MSDLDAALKKYRSPISETGPLTKHEVEILTKHFHEQANPDLAQARAERDEAVAALREIAAIANEPRYPHAVARTKIKSKARAALPPEERS